MPKKALVTVSVRRQAKLATLPARLEDARHEFRQELAKELTRRVRPKLPARTGQLSDNTDARVGTDGSVGLFVQADGGRNLNWVKVLEDGAVIVPKKKKTLRFVDRSGQAVFRRRVVIPRRRTFSRAVKAVEVPAAQAAFKKAYGNLDG